jgi:hypothetical protein
MFRHTDKAIRVKQLGLLYYTVDAAVLNTKTEGGEGCVIEIHHKSATTSGTIKTEKERGSLSYKEEHIQKRARCAMQIYLNNRRPTRSSSPLRVVRDLLPKFYFLAIESAP